MKVSPTLAHRGKEPPGILQLRGAVRWTAIEGLAAAYVFAAKRYFGDSEGQGWVAQPAQLVPITTRIVISPTCTL
jgi:hypothetical protein